MQSRSARLGIGIAYSRLTFTIRSDCFREGMEARRSPRRQLMIPRRFPVARSLRTAVVLAAAVRSACVCAVSTEDATCRAPPGARRRPTTLVSPGRSGRIPRRAVVKSRLFIAHVHVYTIEKRPLHTRRLYFRRTLEYSLLRLSPLSVSRLFSSVSVSRESCSTVGLVHMARIFFTL